MDAPLIELRQYRCQQGQRDEMMAMFEAHFRPAYEAAGARILVSFRVAQSPDLWLWMRAFDSAAARVPVLQAFYGSAVWAALKADCNALLLDCREARLLRPRQGDLAALRQAGWQGLSLSLWRPRPGQRARHWQALQQFSAGEGWLWSDDEADAEAMKLAQAERPTRRGACLCWLHERAVPAWPTGLPAPHQQLRLLPA